MLKLLAKIAEKYGQNLQTQLVSFGELYINQKCQLA